MTYNVFSGTLNPTQSINILLIMLTHIHTAVHSDCTSTTPSYTQDATPGTELAQTDQLFFLQESSG